MQGTDTLAPVPSACSPSRPQGHLLWGGHRGRNGPGLNMQRSTLPPGALDALQRAKCVVQLLVAVRGQP